MGVEAGSFNFQIIHSQESIFNKSRYQVQPGAVSREETAEHEMNHASVLMAHGAGIKSVSTLPAGNILGVTVPESNVATHVFQESAAAGSLPTSFGPGRGHSSDMFKVAWAAMYGRGMSVASAVAGAETKKRGMYNPDVFVRMSKILAYKGAVQGSSGVKAMEIQAKKELAIEEKHKTGTHVLISYSGEPTVTVSGILKQAEKIVLPTRQNLLLVKRSDLDSLRKTSLADSLAVDAQKKEHGKLQVFQIIPGVRTEPGKRIGNTTDQNKSRLDSVHKPPKVLNIEKQVGNKTNSSKQNASIPLFGVARDVYVRKSPSFAKQQTVA